MNDNQGSSNTGLLSLGAQTGAQKTGEFFVSRALNALVDVVKKGYSGAQVLLGTAFSRYLLNATQRYNQVKTLATGLSPRTLIGEGSIYVSIGVKHNGKHVDTDTVESMLRISNNVMILGTGGIGKSMMMRYLFLNTANRGEFVPVFLELRKISNQDVGKLSILDLIYTCLNDFDIQLPKDQFEYSLRLGKYIFFMDGLDEVKECHTSEAAAAIQSFCAKYPKNPCIITSRPRKNTSPLETFSAFEALPLNKSQAISLASKIWTQNDKTVEFCRQLDEELYEKHQDFAENPLLLSMMFLTFMRNSSIPNHLSEFYSKAYDALYSSHDGNDKGYYLREFRCNLDEPGFRRILSHFCFHSYFKEDYDFSKDTLLVYLQKSIEKCGFSNIKPKDYLEDLQNVVCLIIEDGDIYRFSHRSFQTYFAAYYTSSILTDEQQRKLFSNILSGREPCWDREDYYELLFQIEPQRFLVNALEEGLKDIYSCAIIHSSPEIYFFKRQYSALALHERDRDGFKVAVYIDLHQESQRYYNYVALFCRYINQNQHKLDNEDRMFVRNIIERVSTAESVPSRFEVTFELIDRTELITDSERSQFYTILARATGESETIDSVYRWLNTIEEGRKKLSSEDFIDEL